MKRFLLFLLTGAIVLATACKKDDSTEQNQRSNVSTEPDPNYVVGQYHTDRQLATMTEDGETQQFTWNDDEIPLLLFMGADGKIRDFEYDEQHRQLRVNIPASSVSGNRIMSYEYSGDHLSHLQLDGGNGTTLLSATTTYNGNRLQRIQYDNVDQEVVSGYINNFLSSRRKDMIENTRVSNLQSDYTWIGGDVSDEHLTATGSTDLAVGELVQRLNLDTSFYRLIIETANLNQLLPGITPQLLADFVDMLSDSTCHIVVDVDLSIHYAYDKHPNPLYGFWGWGFLGNTRVLSSHNILTSRREGKATANLRVNLPSEVPDRYDLTTSIMLSLALAYLNNRYPDGFNYNYPIDLGKTEHYNYSYDQQGWPSSMTDDDNNTTSFTYED